MSNKEGNFIALTPLLVFVSIFILSSILVQPLSPIFTCFVAILYSFFIFKEKITLNKKIEIFIQGSAQHTVIAMCYIFLLSSVFTYTLNKIGGIESAVKIGMYIIPTSFILPGFFILVSIFATAIGSSMGAITAFMPIGVGVAQSLQINPALFAGIIVNGAMFGDNLSLISDTTIAAIQTTGSTMKAKFLENLRFVLPASIITIITYILLNIGYISPAVMLQHGLPTTHDFVNIIPYILVFLMALLGYDVIVVLMIGISAAAAIGISLNIFTLYETSNIILEGFSQDKGSIEVLILVLFVAGLSYIVDYNGGIQYLLHKLSNKITHQASALAHIISLVFFANAAIAINTITILVTGPVAKKIGDQFHVPSGRIAALIDIVACICQGILPYAPQLLLAASLAKISPIAIMPYLIYQWVSLLILLGFIVYTYIHNKKALS